MSQPRYLSKVLTAGSATAISASQTPAGAGNLLINGSAASGGVATLSSQRQVLFTFAADESAHSFVLTGTDDQGKVISETVAGAAATAVSALNYKTVTSIAISAAAAGAITVGTNGVGATPWNIVNPDIGAFNIGIGVNVAGTVNFTFQYTYDDVSGTYPNPLNTVPTAFSLTALASKAVNTDSNLTIPISAYRLQVNSGTGTAQAIVIQSGFADS